MADDKSPNLCIVNFQSVVGSKGGVVLRPVRLTRELYSALQELTEAGESVDWNFVGIEPGVEIRPYPLYTITTANPDWVMRWARSQGAEVSKLREHRVE